MNIFTLPDSDSTAKKRRLNRKSSNLKDTSLKAQMNYNPSNRQSYQNASYSFSVTVLAI